MSSRHSQVNATAIRSYSFSSEQDCFNNGMIAGDNGDLSHKSTGCLGLDLSFKLVRGLSDHEITSMIQKIIKTNDVNQIVDLFVLMFATRNCRGGKGERDLFTSMFLSLYTHFPLTCHSLLSLIPEFGRWKDLVTLAEKSGKLGVLENSFYDFIVKPDRSQTGFIRFYLKDICMRELGKQIGKDWIESSEAVNDFPISLAAKWAPRENGAFQKKNSIAFNAYVDGVLDGTVNSSLDEEHKKRAVRKIVSSLSKKLDVAEQKMCSGRYSEIDYTTIPSVNLNKFRKAHLNQKLKKDTEESFLPRRNRFSDLDETKDTGDRFPDNPDRVLGRQHLLAATRSSKVKGGQLQPHEIVSKFLFQYGESCWRRPSSSSNLSSEEKEVFEAQWRDLRSKVSSKVKGNFLPIADVSGSMGSGCSDVKPIGVSIAMSILLSEMTHEAFRDRVITFSQTPRWVQLSSTDTLEVKINKVSADHSDAGNTNLVATFELILQLAKEFNLKSEDLPDLVIFSDMQFDSAIQSSSYGSSHRSSGMDSTFETIDRMFLKAGLIRPKIVYWNLNCKDGTPVSGSTPNTVLLSGYSPSLFKYLMFGEDVPEVTPLTIYRQMIDDKIYDSIRSVISSSSEGIFSGYFFTPVIEESDDRKVSSSEQDETDITENLDKDVDSLTSEELVIVSSDVK